MNLYLKYTGTGILIGVPSRNLTQAEAEQHGIVSLISSGAYERIPEEKPAQLLNEVIQTNTDEQPKRIRRRKESE